MKINLKSLTQIVRQNLFEADALKRKKGKFFDPNKSIESLLKEPRKNGMLQFCFRMTGVEKLGINPNYNFNTPRGIYFYPLDKSHFEELKRRDLPYAKEEKYVVLAKIKNPEKWLNVSSEEEIAGWQEICKKMCKIALERAGIDTNDTQFVNHFYELIHKNAKYGTHYEINDSCKIYDFAYFLSNNISGRIGKSPSSIWQLILIKVGYEGVYDYGSSVIHENEPYQLVALTSSAMEIVESLDNNLIHRYHNIQTGTYDLETIEDRKIMSAIVRSKTEKNTKLLKKFISLGINEIQTNIARRVDIDPEVLVFLFNSTESDYVQIEIARNVITPHYILEKLSLSNKDNIRRAVARNPECPTQIIDTMLKDDSYNVRYDISKRKKLSQIAFETLSKDKQDSIRMRIASREDTPANVLASMTGDTSVAYALINNPYTPIFALEELAKHGGDIEYLSKLKIEKRTLNKA